MKLLKKLSFRKKIFAGMTVAAIVPMLGGYLLLMQVIHIIHRNNLREEAQYTLKTAEESLERTITEICTAVGELCEMEDIVAFLVAEGSPAETVYRDMYLVSNKYSNYANFALYDRTGTLKMSVADNKYINEKLSLNWNILYTSAKEPEKYVVRNARLYEGEQRVEYLRVGHAVLGESGGVEGYVIATVTADNFYTMLKGIGGVGGVLYVMDGFREIVYSSAGSYTEGDIHARNVLLQTPEPYPEETGDSIYYLAHNDAYDLYIMYRQPIASLNNMESYVREIAVFSGILSMCVCLLLSWYFSRSIYKPVQRLQHAIKEIEKGNYAAQVKVSGDDELGQLTESFNAMSGHLMENTQRLVQRERELSDSNIKMMQAQLKPHFLYNTLDTMKWMAKENGLPEVVSLASNLAKILRMSISAKPVIKLSDEISLVEAYTEIQKIRFADKFELVVDVPEELEDCMVPKLMLQPIVENSIIHGFAEREAGMVLVQASVTDAGDMQILIQDDGVGMTEEETAQLNALKTLPHVEESGHENIGYYNVNAIIQLHYGEQYGLRAESEKGVGTKIYMTLPVQR